MKKWISLLTLCFSLASIMAQPGDTTIVQTFTFEEQNDPETAYDSPGRRWFSFPDDETTYQKILMYHTLKCFEDGTAGNLGYPCGEWDYLTYTYLYDHTGVLDSNALEHPRFLLNNQDFESADLLTTPQNNTQMIPWSGYSLGLMLDQEFEAEIGASTDQILIPGEDSGMGFRSQHIYTADELQAAGVQAGTISTLSLNFATQEGAVNSLINLGVKFTEDETLSDFHEDFNPDYQYIYSSSVLEDEWHRFWFSPPLNWDGTSSLVLDLTIETNEPELGLPLELAGEMNEASEGMSLIIPKGNSSQKYAEFSGSDFIRLSPDVFQNVDEEVTISFWLNGDEEIQPSNSTVFEGLDENGNRVLNAHLPWGNGRVYWDAGWDGGYDRIDKQANESDYEGGWNHWAFTKNTSTGEMKIFLNGSLWHSGTDRDNSMSGLARFRLGSGANGSNYYHGKIDEFRIWNKELSESVISEWMSKSVTNEHPEYENLLVQYHFNEGYGDPISSDGGIQEEALALGSVNFMNYASEDIFFQEQNYETILRPQIILTNGDYEVSEISGEYALNIPIAPQSLAEYEVVGNDVEIANLDYYWLPGETFVFDEQGNVIETIELDGADTTVENDILSYFGEPFEIVDRYEIGRYITPYGIGLDMEDGWTWVYDVTDFAPLLKGEVELQAGNWQELLDLKFAFIEGIPSREVKRVEKLWSGSIPLSSFNESVEEKEITILEDEHSFRLKATTSGHQFDNPTNCAEFCYKIHSVDVDGNMEYSWQIMEECADNPLYPQGGTWIYDRAGWCPGAPVTTQNMEIEPLTDSGSFTVDYNIDSDPYGNYVFEGYLISYGEFNYQYDVEVNDILAPNRMKIRSRMNPICNNPKVLIRNNGSEILTSCTIEFGVNGQMESFEWKGELGYMQTEEVELYYPDPSIWRGADDEVKIFEVSVSNPNGVEDENPSNNLGRSEFYPPVFYSYDDFEDNRLIIWVTTNNFPQENSYTLYDSWGNVVFERNDLTQPNTYYRDTIPLDPGCYHFHLRDSDDDGLGFWANNDGNGTCRFKRVAGSSFVTFERDFGKEIHHYFGWNLDPLNVPTSSPELTFNLFPNPAEELFYVDLSNWKGECDMAIFSSNGSLIEQRSAMRGAGWLETIDVSNYSPGIYLVKLSNSNSTQTKRLIVQ